MMCQPNSLGSKPTALAEQRSKNTPNLVGLLPEKLDETSLKIAGHTLDAF